jgi:hypothetical protein
MMEYMELPTNSCKEEYYPEKMSNEKVDECRHDYDSNSNLQQRVVRFVERIHDIRENSLQCTMPSRPFSALKKVAETFCGCEPGYDPGAPRVTNNMESRYLEDDYYELVYRPSKRNLPLKNMLASTPTFEDDVLTSILTVISERSEDRTIFVDSHSRMSQISQLSENEDFEYSLDSLLGPLSFQKRE